MWTYEITSNQVRVCSSLVDYLSHSTLFSCLYDLGPCMLPLSIFSMSVVFVQLPLVRVYGLLALRFLRASLTGKLSCPLALEVFSDLFLSDPWYLGIRVIL